MEARIGIDRHQSIHVRMLKSEPYCPEVKLSTLELVVIVRAFRAFLFSMPALGDALCQRVHSFRFRPLHTVNGAESELATTRHDKSEQREIARELG